MIASLRLHVEGTMSVTFHRINNINKNKLLKFRHLIFFFSLAHRDLVNLHNTIYRIIILCKSYVHLLQLRNIRYDTISLGNKRPQSYPTYKIECTISKNKIYILRAHRRTRFTSLPPAVQFMTVQWQA